MLKCLEKANLRRSFLFWQPFDILRQIIIYAIFVFDQVNPKFKWKKLKETLWAANTDFRGMYNTLALPSRAKYWNIDKVMFSIETYKYLFNFLVYSHFKSLFLQEIRIGLAFKHWVTQYFCLNQKKLYISWISNNWCCILAE